MTAWQRVFHFSFQVFSFQTDYRFSVTNNNAFHHPLMHNCIAAAFFGVHTQKETYQTTFFLQGEIISDACLASLNLEVSSMILWMMNLDYLYVGNKLLLIRRVKNSSRYRWAWGWIANTETWAMRISLSSFDIYRVHSAFTFLQFSSPWSLSLKGSCERSSIREDGRPQTNSLK